MKNNSQDIQLDDRRLLLIGIPLVSVLSPLIFFKIFFYSYEPQVLLVQFGWSALYTTVYWLFCRWIFFKGIRRFGKPEEVRKRIIWEALPIIAFTLTFCNALNLVLAAAGFNRNYTPSPWEANLASMSNVILGIAIYESMYFFNQWKKVAIENEVLERKNIHSQLETLKNQVNPHFLFNSLNTLNYLITDNPDRAQRFVQKLSKAYRYILEIRDKRLIPLKEELDFLNAYVFLIKERFGENLRIQIDVPESCQLSQAPPLSLQMLFENAIKHNIISTEKPLSIDLFVENKRLIVRNNLQKKNQLMESTGFGLDNIKSRYAFLSDQAVDVIVTSGAFIVSLPLIDPEVQTRQNPDPAEAIV